MWLVVGIAIITIVLIIILFFMGVSASKASTCPKCGERSAMELIESREISRARYPKEGNQAYEEKICYEVIYRCKHCHCRVIRHVEEDEEYE